MVKERYMEQEMIDTARSEYRDHAINGRKCGNLSPYQFERRFLIEQARWVRRNVGHRSEYYQQCMVGLRQGYYNRELV